VTGCWSEEVCGPYMVWTRAGLRVDISTPGGVTVPFDPASLKPEAVTDDVTAFLDDPEAKTKVTTPITLSKVMDGATDYDVLFVAGGAGAMMDLTNNKTLHTLIAAQMMRPHAIVAAVCHGVCSLVHVMDSRTQRPLLQGKRVTGFSNEEERLTGKNKLVPFALESALVKAGASYSKAAEPWAPHVVTDVTASSVTTTEFFLVTGQNPASAAPLANEVLKLLAGGGGPYTPR